jgi:tRNA threonylcarbamoyladenosine biosynthesis protein TsaB
MRILALETSTSACTVGVIADKVVLSELTLQVPRAHSTRLMPLIAQAVAESGLHKGEIDGIAVGVGPGSFTGLRIGLATAKGLAFALDKPCVGVSTLKAMAYATGAQIGLVVSMLDAKRGDLFAGVYAAGDPDPETWAELVPPSHIHVDRLVEQLQDLRTGLRHSWQFITLCGDAAPTYLDRFPFGEAVRVAPHGALLPRAWAIAAVGRSLLERGEGQNPDHLLPIYLRKSEAETLWEARKSPSSP